MLNPKRFQTYDLDADPANCAPRLAGLRKAMAAQKLDGFVIPRGDAHQGEYVAPRDERLSWLTGFTGSAGAAIAMADKAAIFVDGRYTIQVRDQVDLALYAVHHLVEDPPHEWLARNVQKGQRIGFDPWMHSQSALETLERAVRGAGGELVPVTRNPVDEAWPDQPDAPLAPVDPHPMSFAGEAASAKRERVGQAIAKAKADAAVLTLPESIAWLLNIRGGDVSHVPLPHSFAILGADGQVDLFLDPRKVTPGLDAHLGNGVRRRAPDEFTSALADLGTAGKRVLADPATAATFIFDALTRARATIVRGADPCLLPKACKNEVEIEGMRNAHIRDGVAISRYLRWVTIEGAAGRISEIEACEKLEDFRRETGALRDLSFDSISGSGPNGAIVHYRVTRKTDRKLKSGELFLIDSGGQYQDGTTDITRTVALGTPTAEERDRFTRVLKGHIALAMVVFPEGTSGAQLDVLARLPLWEAGLDYDHGTGHGVGAYLSVHEGPQNISKKPVVQPLVAGMICSNEPGYYKTGGYGIRVENLIVVREAKPVPGAERKMLCFETITLAPIDLALVDVAMLTSGERDWLNAYHARVHATLAPHMSGADGEWLKHATRAV